MALTEVCPRLLTWMLSPITHQARVVWTNILCPPVSCWCGSECHSSWGWVKQQWSREEWAGKATASQEREGRRGMKRGEPQSHAEGTRCLCVCLQLWFLCWCLAIKILNWFCSSCAGALRHPWWAQPQLYKKENRRKDFRGAEGISRGSVEELYGWAKQPERTGTEQCQQAFYRKSPFDSVFSPCLMHHCT